MKILEIKKLFLGISDGELTRLFNDNWIIAESALKEISDTDYRETPIEQYPLQLLCLVSNDKDGFHNLNSAKKERIVENMKKVLNPIGELLDSKTEFELPTYSVVANLTPQDGERSLFAEQLKSDFKRMNQNASDALATVLYAVVYAYYRDFEDADILFSMKYFVDAPYDIGDFARMTNENQIDALNEATKNVYSTPKTNASAAYSSFTAPRSSANTYHPVKSVGYWRPLKTYLIITTIFVAVVFGLVYWSMSSGIGASAMSIMDTSGKMVAIEPDMEPATLYLFGTVDYDGLISGIKTFAVIFIIWRVVLITAVFRLNSYRRRKVTGVIP